MARRPKLERPQIRRVQIKAQEFIGPQYIGSAATTVYDITAEQVMKLITAAFQQAANENVGQTGSL